MTAPLIESPCVGVCTLDDQGFCIGCFRSGEEIALWVSLGSAERERIMDELPDREAATMDSGSSP